MMSPSVLLWPLMSWLVAAEFQIALWHRMVVPDGHRAVPAEAGAAGAVVVFPFRRLGGVALPSSRKRPGELIPFPTFRPAG